MLDESYIKDAEKRARRFQGAWYGTSGSLAADVIHLLKERKQLMGTVAELEAANAELRHAVAERLAATPADDPKLTGYSPMAASLAGCPPAQAAAAACLSDPPADLGEAAARWKAMTAASAAKYHAERQPMPPIEQPGEEPDADYILRGQAELRAERQSSRTPYRGPEAFLGRWAATRAAEADRREADRREADSQRPLRPGSREFLAVLDELRDLHLRKTLDYGVDEDALSNIRSSADVCNMPAWAGCVLRMMDKMHRIKAFFRRGRTEFDGVEDTLMDLACYAAIALVLYREEQSARSSTPPAGGASPAGK